MIPALVQSGLPCDRFVFEGFLPAKKGRKKRLKNFLMKTEPLFFTNHHTSCSKLLTSLVKSLGLTSCFNFEELSKMFEETFRGTINQALNHFKAHPPKGEFVICVGGYQKK